MVKLWHGHITPLALALAFAAGCNGSISAENAASADALAGSTTTAFQRGALPSASYAGVTDTGLSAASPSLNKGGEGMMVADADTPNGSGKNADLVLRFDLSSIPAGSTVQAASLTFNVGNGTSGSGFAFYELKRAFVEGQANWTSASTGATWEVAGARGASDRGMTVLTTWVPATTGKSTVTLNSAGLAVVQAWIADPSRNKGLVLDNPTNGDGVWMDSSETATVDNRPKLTLSYTPPSATPSGTGLTGEYFNGKNFEAKVLSRTDAQVNFDWQTGSPSPAVNADGFSARWTGDIVAATSETYTLYTSSDDGIRLFINDQPVINLWTDHAPTETSGTLAMTAGVHYRLRLEFYENAGGAVAKLLWSSAGVPKQVVPTSALFPTAPLPPPPSDIEGLDATGNTLPDTSYAPPADAIFMDTRGNDTNAGSLAAPVKSLARAVALVPAGGTIVVRGGVYRDGIYASVWKVFALQAYPHEQPWFDGTDVVTDFSAAGNGQWSTPWSTPGFCAGQYYSLPYTQQSATGPCAYYDESYDNPASADPQMVFLDGQQIPEVSTLAAAVGNKFFYDQADRKLFLGFAPGGHTVELAARAVALVLEGGAGGNSIRGIGFRKYATNEFDGNRTAGAVMGGMPNIRFENDVFTLNAGDGLHFSVPRGAVLYRNVFARNGANGMNANGSGNKSSTQDNMVIESNIFDRNNTERFGVGSSYSSSAAGSKVCHMNGFLLKNNIFQNGVVSKGFWCDMGCQNGKMVGNIFRNNDDTGLFYEISNTGLIASNLIYGNGAYGLKAGSANTKIFNNTLVNNGINALIYDDSRPPGQDDGGPDTVNVQFVNNILSGGPQMVSGWRCNTTAGSTGPNSFYTALNYNSYYRPAGSPTRLYDWRDGTSTAYGSCSALNAAKGWEAQCQDVTSGSDPFFVNASAQDYRVRSSSAAYLTGQPLPGDVAALLGVPAGQAVSRGAVQWVGMP